MDLAGRIRLGGLVAALSAALIVSATTLQGTAPVIFGLGLGLTVLLGEVVLDRPRRGRMTTATLHVRRIRDYAPGAALRGVVALVIGFALVAAGAAAVAASLAGTDRVYGGWGLLDLVPTLAVTLAAGLLLGWAALRQVARAPRTGEDDDAASEMWRRRTTTTIVAALGVLASVSVVGAVAAIGSLVGGAVAVLGPVAVLAVLALGWYSMLFVRSDLAVGLPQPKPTVVPNP